MSIEFTPQQLKAFRAEFCKGFNDDQFEVSMAFCQLRDLLPGKHVLFQLRRSKEWDDYVRAKVDVTKVVFITTIDAARLIALRSKEYTGQDPETYIYLDGEGNPSVESKIPLPRVPLPQTDNRLCLVNRGRCERPCIGRVSTTPSRAWLGLMPTLPPTNRIIRSG